MTEGGENLSKRTKGVVSQRGKTQISKKHSSFVVNKDIFYRNKEESQQKQHLLGIANKNETWKKQNPTNLVWYRDDKYRSCAGSAQPRVIDAIKE